MPYFAKPIDVGELPMPHFNFAQKGDLATTAEISLQGNLIADSSRQGKISTASQHTDQPF